MTQDVKYPKIHIETTDTSEDESDSPPQENWASLARLDIPPPKLAQGHLKPFLVAKRFKKELSIYSRRLSTLIVTGYEGAFLRKLKDKKRLVYWQAPDVSWPQPAKKDWTKVGDWLETLIWEPNRVALAMTIHSSFEVVASYTAQQHRLRDNFYVPAPRGQVALPVINPYVIRDLVYAPQGQKSLLFIGDDPMGGGLDLLLEAWNDQQADWKRQYPLMVASRIKQDTRLWKWVEALMPQGLEFINIDELDHHAVSELILQSRCVVLPNRVEEQGGFHLWTVALGANLLTTMVGSLPDIVGQEAVLVEAGDRESLSKALSRALVEVPEEKLYERRRQFAWDTFGSQMRAHRFAEMFQSPEKIAGAIFEEDKGPSS